MMTTRVRGMALGCVLIAAFGASPVDDPPRAPARRALLVGCTKYQLESVRELWGPANDAPLWSKLLIEGFGYRESDITRLVGWPDDPSKRPTRANIASAIEMLIEQSAEGDQVVIVLSGHGAQVPIPPEKQGPENPEPDGLDEAFLPADVKAWTPEGVENAILDDEIGAWLDRFRARGVNVWIVFDCCHSGTMTRGGGPSEVERSRTTKPGDLHIPDKAIADALARAQTLAKNKPDPGVAKPANDPKGKGSVVAFYAAQPFEESPELPRPDDAAQVRENYYGLFSYTLTTALSQRGSPLSYRELAHIVATRYRADRRSRPPTAFAEGDLDREVLGLNTWPDRSSILLKKTGSDPVKLTVNAGGLAGLAEETILAIHPPIGDSRPPDMILGYVKVASSTPFSSEVEPVKYGDEPEVKIAGIPDGARCQPTERNLGDSRVSIAIIARNEADRELVRKALAQMPAATRALVDEAKEPAKAEWWLQVEGDVIHLSQGPGRAPESSGETDRSYERYPRTDLDRLTSGLARDFTKIYKWQAVWRVTGSITPGDDDAELKLEVFRASGEFGKVLGPIESSPLLRPKDWIEIRLHNESKDDLWVTMLALDARFGIMALPVGSIKAGKSRKPFRIEVGDESFGAEGLVVFGTPIEANRDQPDFRFLEQEPLGKPNVIEHLKGQAPSSPFSRLMESAVFGETGRGLLRVPVSAEPRVAAATWVTIRRDSK